MEQIIKRTNRLPIDRDLAAEEAEQFEISVEEVDQPDRGDKPGIRSAIRDD
jgi:hypothetical protein